MTFPSVGGRGASGRPVSIRTAALIRELVTERHRQHLTARQVLNLMGNAWSLTALQNVECGHASPTVEFLACWAEALGRPLTLGGPS